MRRVQVLVQRFRLETNACDYTEESWARSAKRPKEIGVFVRGSSDELSICSNNFDVFNQSAWILWIIWGLNSLHWSKWTHPIISPHEATPPFKFVKSLIKREKVESIDSPWDRNPPRATSGQCPPGIQSPRGSRKSVMSLDKQAGLALRMLDSLSYFISFPVCLRSINSDSSLTLDAEN